jgi:hypothetical protein
MGEAIKAIASIHTAEINYYGSHGRWRRLQDLGPEGENLISAHIAIGAIEHYWIRLDIAATGYQIIVSPRAPDCSRCRSFYSDQTMLIRMSRTPETASSSSPVLGQ